MRFVRYAVAAALLAAIYLPAAQAAVAGGAVASGAMTLIDWAIGIVLVVIPGFIIVWGLMLGRGLVALGGIAAAAIGLLIAVNAVEIGSLIARG